MKKMMKSKYTLYARAFPAALTMIPFVVLYIWVLAPLVEPILKPVWEYLPVVTGVSINLVLLYLFEQLNRFVSKVCFQDRIFKDDLHFPTTDILMPSNPMLDNETRKRYFELIKRDFDVDVVKSLSKLKTDGEKRMMLTRLVGQIRPMLKNNSMVQQHNREFGFVRNFVGGSVGALLVSIAIIAICCYSPNDALLITAIVMVVFYLLCIILSKVLIIKFGKNYAYVLFEQYACLDRNEKEKE